MIRIVQGARTKTSLWKGWEVWRRPKVRCLGWNKNIFKLSKKKNYRSRSHSHLHGGKTNQQKQSILSYISKAFLRFLQKRICFGVGWGFATPGIEGSGSCWCDCFQTDLVVAPKLELPHPQGSLGGSSPGDARNASMKNVDCNGQTHDLLWARVFWGNIPSDFFDQYLWSFQLSTQLRQISSRSWLDWTS